MGGKEEMIFRANSQEKVKMGSLLKYRQETGVQGETSLNLGWRRQKEI